jgi:hypothetical protein
MSVVGNLSRHENLAELTQPRQYPSYQSVAMRQAIARMNLGLVALGSGSVTAAALNATGTLTAAMMTGGVVTSTTAAAVTATLDTGANLEAALKTLLGPVLPVGLAIEFSVVNTGANAFTIATAAGWTDGGGGFQAVAAGTSDQFRVVRTAANSYTIYKVG